MKLLPYNIKHLFLSLLRKLFFIRCNLKRKNRAIKILSIKHLQIAFDLNKNEQLTQQHLDICEEWNSGKGEDFMKISTDDPRLLEYVALHDKLEKKKETVWNQLIN
jgi:hypothetical protein